MAQTTLGDIIRYYRKRARLTQKQLAQAIAFDHSLISKVERDKLLPSPEFVGKFVQVETLHLTAEERRVIYDKYQEEQKRRAPLPTKSAVRTKLPGNESNDVAEQHTSECYHQLRWRQHWPVILSTTLLLLLTIALLLFHSPRGPIEHPLSKLQSPNKGHLIVIDALQLFPSAPLAGESTTVTVHLQNQSTRPIHWLKMEVAVRGPHAQSLGWDAPQEDFPGIEYMTLQPGEEYLYVQTRSFDLPGDYFAEPVMLDDKGQWGGILPYPRVWFTVTRKDDATP